MSLSDLITIATLIGGTVAVVVQLRLAVVQLRIAGKIANDKIEQLSGWMKKSDRRIERVESALLALLDRSSLSESGIFQIRPVDDPDDK